MTAAATAFESLGPALLAEGAKREQMMGSPMFSVNGKMFACLSNERLGVRLGGGTAELDEALALEGATFFSPGNSDRVWRDWVSLPLGVIDAWPGVALRALHNRLA